MIGLGLGIAQTAVRQGKGSPYSPQATAYFAAMTVQEPNAVKMQIDTFIAGLVADETWNLIDRMILPLGTEQASLLDVRQPNKIATNVNGAAFTAYKGFKGNGSSAYLGFGDAMNASTIFTQNSAFYFYYTNVQTSGQSVANVGDAGNTYTFGGYNVENGTTGLYRLNTVMPIQLPSYPTRKGSWLYRRASSATSSYYLNAGAENATASTSTVVNAFPFTVLRRQASYGTDTIGAAGYGGGISDMQALSFQTRLHALMTALGANY